MFKYSIDVVATWGSPMLFIVRWTLQGLGILTDIVHTIKIYNT